MAVVCGLNADATDGPMTAAEIVAFLFSKSGWRSQDKKIYKAFENCGEATVFFASTDRSLVSSVGIGEHSGESSATATYTLVWRSSSRKPAKMVEGQPAPAKQIKLYRSAG